MDPHLTAITSFIIHYGYFVILPIAILEGPIITVIAAFLSAQGYFNIFIVYAVVVVGDVLGDILYYYLGFFGGKIAGTKIGKKLGVDEKKIAALEQHFNVHSGKTLLIGKWTHSLGWAALMGAGAAKMPIGKFTWYNVLGTLPKSLIFALLGFYVGYAYQKINSVIDKVFLVVGIVMVCAAISYFIAKRARKKQA